MRSFSWLIYYKRLLWDIYVYSGSELYTNVITQVFYAITFVQAKRFVQVTTQSRLFWRCADVDMHCIAATSILHFLLTPHNIPPPTCCESTWLAYFWFWAPADRVYSVLVLFDMWKIGKVVGIVLGCAPLASPLKKKCATNMSTPIWTKRYCGRSRRHGAANSNQIGVYIQHVVVSILID